jgi:hypothetical protein
MGIECSQEYPLQPLTKTVPVGLEYEAINCRVAIWWEEDGEQAGRDHVRGLITDVD